MVSLKMSREMKRDTFCVTDGRTKFLWRTEELGILVVGWVKALSVSREHVLIYPKSSRWEDVSTAGPINFSSVSISHLKSHKYLKLSVSKYFGFNQWQYYHYGPCDTILNAVLRSWYLSNWNKCVGRRAQVGLLSNRHCWRETRYLSSNWRSSYCTTSVTRRRQGPRLTWKSKSSGEPSYCTPNCHPTWFLRRFLDTLRWLSCLPIQLYKPSCGSLIHFYPLFHL